ncbi:MAG: YbjQ family protein [Terriglobales bacterium]
MLVATTDCAEGYQIKRVMGQVFGVVVRSRSIVGNVAASLRSLAGGEITEYTHLVEDTRRHAIDRMIENARAIGGNAILAMRFDSSEMGQTMSEVVAYGTAVVLDPAPPE